ncbi:hypothetical protein BBW69_07120 [Neisseria sp. RH3002v2f]|nr:hypothetical protein [Neisseria sp. RH3002v2f]
MFMIFFLSAVIKKFIRATAIRPNSDFKKRENDKFVFVPDFFQSRVCCVFEIVETTGIHNKFRVPYIPRFRGQIQKVPC